MPRRNTKDETDFELSESKKQAIARAMSSARSKQDRIHVIVHGKEKWAVLPEGAKRSYKIYGDQSEAVSDAKKLARKKNASSVVIHGQDGAPVKTFNIKN